MPLRRGEKSRGEGNDNLGYNLGHNDNSGHAGTIRPARVQDIADLIRMKIALATADGTLDAVRATPGEWERDLFGSAPRFVAFVAEHDHAAIGMAICSERFVTGWGGPTVYLQDLFVDPAHRRRGIGEALMAQIAAFAVKRGSPIIEINVRADNPACHFYRETGFQEVTNCAVYFGDANVLHRLAALAGGEQSK
jgi:ribosomal protein S18 acetylase RimI-like enzyme